MRYSSAVVLSTLTVGHAAAAHSHNRHVGFHARREAAKRDEPVDYSKLSYDLSNVNWDEVNKEVNWSSVFASPAATPTPAASDKKPAPDVAPTAAAPTSKPAETPNAAKPAPAVPNNPGGEVVENTFVGVASIANKIGAKVGKNEESDNGGIWVGGDGPWGMDVTNSGTTDSVFFCWKANGFSGMSINTNVPEISVGMKPRQSVQLSFAPNVPAACAPASATDKLAFFGGVNNTWAEVTFGQNGAFDVSRNVKMDGSIISMQGSKCTSDMDTCVFKCKDPNVKSCEKGPDYALFNCHAGNGGGGGYDPIMAGDGGGCAMASDGERIKVAFS